MNLKKLRGKIDALDSKIIDLFNERANVAKESGQSRNVQMHRYMHLIEKKR